MTIYLCKSLPSLTQIIRPRDRKKIHLNPERGHVALRTRQVCGAFTASISLTAPSEALNVCSKATQNTKLSAFKAFKLVYNAYE